MASGLNESTLIPDTQALFLHATRHVGCTTTCSGASNDLLDLLFHRIPVTSIETIDFGSQVGLDVAKLFPALPIVDESYGNTYTSESTCATNTMEVSFRISLTVDRFWNVL